MHCQMHCVHALGSRVHTKVGCASQGWDTTLRFFAGAAGAVWSATALGGVVVVSVAAFADWASVLWSVADGDVDINCEEDD